MNSPEPTPVQVSDSGRWRAIAPLRHPHYRLLIGAVALSTFGAGMWTIVMVFQVIAIDDNPIALSVVGTCMSVGLLVFALVGGIVADRAPHRTILIGIETLNFATVAAVSVLSLTGVIQLWHMAVAAGLLGASMAFFYPAYSAYLPRILPPEQLLAANGIEGAMRPSLQQALGPAIGGVVVGMLFPAAGAVVVALASLTALVMLTFLPRERRQTEPEEAEPRASVLADLREGVGFTVRTRWLFWTLLFACLQLLAIMGPIEVLLPFIAKATFDDGEEMYGLLLTAFGLGSAAGSIAMSSWRLPRRYLTVMVLLWGVGGIPFAVIGYTQSFLLMAAALLVVGATSGAAMVIWGTLLQRRVPHHMLGRVSSLDFFVSIALMPLSIALAGPLAAVIPVSIIFLGAGVIPAVLALIVLVAGRLPRDERAHPLDAVAAEEPAPA